MVAGLLALTACGGNQGALEDRVRALEAENAALKAQLAQAGAGAAQARQAAGRSAVASYARQCSMALEIKRIDDPSGMVPASLNALACDAPALGADAVQKGGTIMDSVIEVRDGGERYRITVAGTDGQTTVYDSP